MILYFDTETTGLKPGNICQLSYLMQDKFKTIAKNFFFTVDHVEYGAYLLHGFSVEKLKTLSGGKVFLDHIDEIEKDFLSADLIVAHNLEFDYKFMCKEFLLANRQFNVKNGFCSMKSTTDVCKLKRASGSGYKYPKLSELCDFYKVSEVEIKLDTKRLFGETSNFHDARFDTTALYLAINMGFDTDLAYLKEYL